MREGDVVLPQDKAFSRAGIYAHPEIAGVARVFVQGNVRLCVLDILVERQFLFYLQIAFLIFHTSDNSCVMLILFFKTSLTMPKVLFRGFPSLSRIFSSISKTTSG